MTQSLQPTSSPSPPESPADQAEQSPPPEPTSDTTPTTTPTAAEQPPPDWDRIREPKEVRILRNLHEGLAKAIDIFDQAPAQKLFVVIQEDEGLRPDIHEVADVRALIQLVLPYRGTQAAVFIFKGQRWMLRPGHPWQIFDGETYIPMVLEGDTEDEALRRDGSMFVPTDVEEIARMTDQETPDEDLPPPADPLPDPAVDPLVQSRGGLPDFLSSGDDDDPEIVAPDA